MFVNNKHYFEILLYIFIISFFIGCGTEDNTVSGSSNNGNVSSSYGYCFLTDNSGNNQECSYVPYSTCDSLGSQNNIVTKFNTQGCLGRCTVYKDYSTSAYTTDFRNCNINYFKDAIRVKFTYGG